MMPEALRQRWRQAITLRRQLGGIDALLYALHRMLERLSGGRARIIRYHIVAQPLGRAPTQTLRTDGKTRIVAVTRGHPLVDAFPRPAAVIERRFAEGARCICATIDGQFAGYLWWKTERYVEDETRCTYVLAQPSRSVWDFDVYVAPRYRLGRTLARLWQEADRRLADQGMMWSFSRISAFNPDSIAAHSRLGIVRRGTATFLIIGRLQLAFMPRAPYLHLSTSEHRTPELTLELP